MFFAERLGCGSNGGMTKILSITLLLLAGCGSDAKKDPVAPPQDVPSSGSASPPAASTSVSAPPDAGGEKTDKQAACDALLDDANSSLDAERIAVDKLCKKDADCMPINGRACGFVCAT